MAWTCVVTPYEVAFLSKQNGARYKPTIIFFFNRLLDIVFTLDIVLNLFTGYYDPHTGQWVLELKKIFKRYMRGWFAVDLISVLPVDYISIAVSEADLRAVRLIRVLRLLRLFKLLRVLRVSRIFRRIESSFDLDYCLIEMLRFAVWTCLLAHWVACGMSLIDSLQPASSWTWLDNYFCEYPVMTSLHLECDALPREIFAWLLKVECDPRDTEIAWDLYVTSLYWSITTITTIGYGDIAPQNPVEVALVIQQQTYPPGEYVFQRGRVADTMYIIKKGLIFCAGRFYCRWNTLKEDCLYKTSKHDDSALTTTYSDIWFIPQALMGIEGAGREVLDAPAAHDVQYPCAVPGARAEPAKRMLTNLVMLIGAFQYGYIIGGLSSILATRDLRKNRYIRTMMELNAFMDEGKFPQSTKRRLREYFKYRANSPDVNSYHAILRALSPTLRGEVARLTDNNWLTHVKGFEGFPGELISEVLPVKGFEGVPGELISE
eukprot:gene11366-13435_t